MTVGEPTDQELQFPQFSMEPKPKWKPSGRPGPERKRPISVNDDSGAEKSVVCLAAVMINCLISALMI